jgi:hypothetical protein
MSAGLESKLRLSALVTSVDIEVTTCPIFPSTSRVFADCDSLIVWDGLSETEGRGALGPWDSVGTGEA